MRLTLVFFRHPKVLSLFQSDKVDRSVKPAVLSCFGDVALAIGPNFNRYYSYVMTMLGMALSSAKVEDSVS